VTEPETTEEQNDESQENSFKDKATRTREWAMYIHFSLLAGYLIPGAGFILPIVLWQIKKDELPGVDTHGRIATNWIISHLIYAVASLFMILIFIGIPMLVVLGVVAVVFPIVGGIKANNGEVWKYPCSIRFLS